ncbi:hypothetical protein V6N13_023698 [Hibiscus sabdariffa]|uniref:F-box domain-containing protein n=1 Tax=Hibiscus sabdariffa TaxID=183260 RepID=A0ABR2PMI1_9ROSI
MANAEAATAKGEEGIVDRLSDLPDELLCRIFSLLPTHQSIRSSCLTSRYRYLWRSVPILDFWDNHYPNGCFKKAMENVLKHHETLANIRRFRLWCISPEYEESLISKWIDTCTTASCSTLQLFDVHVAWKYRLDLTPTIFSCHKLERIRLSGGIIIPIPIDTPVVFPCLKTLRFKSISVVGGNTLNKLLSGCPRIEIFDVEDCIILSDISTHKFTLEKLYIKYQLKPSRIHEDGDSNRVLSLASASIVDVACTDYKSRLTFDFLMSISGLVKQLEICMYKAVNYGNKDVNGVAVWQNLTHLVVKPRADDYLYGSQVLSLLLQNSPNLISLVLEKPRMKVREGVGLPSVFYYKLHTVKIDGLGGSEEMGIVRYFLKNALDLKELIIVYYSITRQIDEERKATIVNEPRASSQCQIEFYVFK